MKAFGQYFRRIDTKDNCQNNRAVDSDRKPVIAQILYSGLGGHGGVVLAMLRADRDKQWQHALAFLGVEPLLPSYTEYCQTENVPFTYLRAIPRQPWRSYLPVAQWLQRTRPDAIILHNMTVLPGVLPYARRNNVPLIAVEHQPNELKSRQEWLFSALCMQFCDTVVTLTPQHQLELKTRLGRLFRANKTVMIPNGIDVEMFGLAQPFAGECQPIKIGMEARFTKSKRFDILIEMLILLQKRDNHKWPLSLAGEGEHWNQIRAYVRSRGIENISFEGMLTGSVLASWYRDLDVYCHASDGETLSVSVLQAMASNLPIIGSNVEGISNLLAGTPPLGELVEAQTAVGFARAVANVVKNPERSKEMANRARVKVEQLYDQRTMFLRYNDLVKNLHTRIRTH